MIKNILIFGASGYVARHFSEKYFNHYNIIHFAREDFDFLRPDFEKLVENLIEKLQHLRQPRHGGVDGIVFLQGINPSFGVSDIDDNQFHDMLSINLSVPLQVIRQIKDWINKSASITFISSIARKKGSYDPSYASAKAGLVGLQQALSNHFSDIRFNTISLGLVGGSPVHEGMTDDFALKHLDAMGGKLVKVDDVCKAIGFLIECDSISRAIIPIDRGFKL